MDEPALNYDILLPFPDHIQLSIDDYRNKLYEMIQQNKSYIRRIQHNRTITNNSKSNNTTGTTTPLTNTNGQAVVTNGRLSSVVRRSSSNIAIRTVKQSVTEPKAPIAQAECSDTDYDTSRSIYRSVSIDKPKNTNTVVTENKQLRERAQSAEIPQNGTICVQRTTTSSSKAQSRRRSQHRTKIFGSFRKSAQHFES
ncbi:unnamed protein product [Onchocerca flexuosa]|uniref:Uncharacterized protein n=1 Tax=Onchocerca flexuosa TaxID=387005 RepID=A0A183HHL1_9BILA|nr:unnamed protein product [Onchocerca flexuosa]